MKTHVILLLVLTLLTVSSTAEARKWTDKSGRFSTEAEFVEAKDGVVTLKKADGATVSIPLEKLSDADRAFVEASRKKTAGAPKSGDNTAGKNDERFELIVKWTKVEAEPIAISRLPDIEFRSRDGQPIKRVFYAFEIGFKDLATNENVTERHTVDQSIPLDKSEGVIVMSDSDRSPKNSIPPSAAMDLTLRTARGLRGTGELRVAFFRDSTGKKQISDWLKIPVDLSK